jgi:hypothetical protein
MLGTIAEYVKYEFQMPQLLLVQLLCVSPYNVVSRFRNWINNYGRFGTSRLFHVCNFELRSRRRGLLRQTYNYGKSELNCSESEASRGSNVNGLWMSAGECGVTVTKNRIERPFHFSERIFYSATVSPPLILKLLVVHTWYYGSVSINLQLENKTI